jgi:hypothetical protein
MGMDNDIVLEKTIELILAMGGKEVVYNHQCL